MKQTKRLVYVKGLKAALKTINVELRDQYSWIAKTENSFVFTAEINHIDQDRNRYSHNDGTFHKVVAPLSVKDGVAQTTVRHAKELFDAISLSLNSGLKCRLLFVKGTKYSIDQKDGIRAAVDPDNWMVRELSGNVEAGFSFILERVE